MTLPSFLSAPPKPIAPLARYGFLGLCLVFLIAHTAWLDTHRWAYHSERHRVLGFVFIFLVANHLAFRFPWPRGVTIALRVAASAWLVFTIGYWLVAMYR